MLIEYLARSSIMAQNWQLCVDKFDVIVVVEASFD